MGNIDQVIQYLNEIQDKLVGILIPTILTTIISLATLVTNSIIQIVLSNRQYKSKQFEIMREHYPKLKSQLSVVLSCYENVMNNDLYKKTFRITEYLDLDWDDYRKNLSDNEIQSIDEFEKNIKIIISTFVDLSVFFENNNMPTSSKKLQKEINSLQKFCVIIKDNRCNSNSANSQNFNYKQVKTIIKSLDKQYNKFC